MIAPSRDTHTNWNDKDPVIKEGVLGFTKDRVFNGSLEYFIGDGVHKYSELMKYAAAPASTSNDPNTLVLRDANGKIDSNSINFPTVPDATPTTKGIVKASTTKTADNAVKSDANGGLDGWKDAIIDAIIASDGSGGLATDENGNMVVDFDQMPTDKFEALLASLKMLIPLEADLDLYVDTGNAAAGDTIIDGRGTPQKPFKTIQACVDYVTGKYALGQYDVTIHIGTGTYNENVTLPNFSRTTGHITLTPTTSGQRDVKIVSVLGTTGLSGRCVTATGGVWYIYNIEAERTENPTASTDNPSAGCFGAQGAGTRLYVLGCSAVQKLPSDPSIMVDSNNYNVGLFSADNGGFLDIGNSSAFETNISAEKSTTKPNSVYAIWGTRQGVIQLQRTRNSPTVNVSGSCDVFLALRNHSQILHFGAGSNLTFSGNMTGKRYAFTTGGYSDMNAAADYFPGDEAGTVDSNTYCYY